MDNDSYSLKDELESMSDIVKCYCEPQMNVCKARTYLAEKCETDWLIFLDADDFLLHDFIEKLDKEDSAVVKTSVAVFSDDSIRLATEENSDSYSRAEISVHQNLTGLMHRDVFFDIGLNEKYYLGGEDFDFLIRLWAKRKWKISFRRDVHYVYYEHFDETSLSHTDDCAKSLFQSLVDNKDFFIEEILNAPDTDKRLKEKWLLENPTQENLEKYAIKLSTEDKLIYSALEFFEDYVYNEILFLVEKSKQKDTDYVFSKEKYEFINCSKSFDITLLENTSFDAVFLDIDLNNISSLVCKEPSLVIRKDIWAEIKGKYSPLDLVVYLLTNYSCFIGSRQSERIKTRKNFINDEFYEKINQVSFNGDIVINEMIRLISAYYCEGMFTVKEKVKYPVTFVLHRYCNENCSYCNWKKGKSTLTDEQMYNNFDKALTHFEDLTSKTNNRILVVQIMGGEPTIWSNWLQNKILERLKKYRFFVLYTNGANKESPLYKSDKAIKKLHIINWREEFTKNKKTKYSFGEKPLFIIQEKDRNTYKEILKNYDGTPVGLAVCKSKDITENVSYDFMKELTELNNPSIETEVIGAFINNVELRGIEAVRKDCRINPIVRNVDCETMRVFPCCNSQTSYPLEEFDFTKKADYSIDCINCNYIY